MSTKPVIAVAFYSTWGHIATLAEEVIKGVEASGAIVKPYVFKETLTEEILTKMHAGSSLNPKYPVLTPNDLKEVDGLIIGAPTRYGRVPAQVSAFFDSCGQLWFTGALVGKFVSMFTSAAGQHGGHETTALTSMPFFVHQGMVFVPIGYSNQFVSNLEYVSGGAPYGASTIAAGDGSRQPLEQELALAQYQGKYFGDFVGTFVKGKHSASIATSAVAAREIPTKEEGYSVPETKETVIDKSTTIPSTQPATNSTATGTQGQQAGTTATQDQSAGTTATQAQQPVAAPTSSAAPAAGTKTRPSEQPQKKKGGFFGCCGAGGIDK